MGCFGVTGTLSNLSISIGNEVVLFPLKQNPNARHKTPREMIISAGSSLDSHEAGACGFFSPRFLPIVGEYNDYGSIDNIKRDANVEYIEDYFGISIEEFVGALTDGDQVNCKTKELSSELHSLSCMFEHKTVYDDVTDYYRKSQGNTFADAAEISEITLAWIRFYNVGKDQIPEELKENDYNYYSNGNGTYVLVRGLYENASFIFKNTEGNFEEKTICSMKDLIREIRSLGQNLIEYGEEDLLYGHSVFDAAAQSLVKRYDYFVRPVEDSLKPSDFPELMEMMMKTMKENTSMVVLMAIEREIPLLGLLTHLRYPIEDIRSSEAAWQLSSLVNFYWMMYNTNRMFMPAYSGPQCPELNDSLAVNDAIRKRAKQMLEERENNH